MSFEEKYKHYQNSGKIDVSEDYVNKMSIRISEKIAERKGIKIPIAWSLSGVSFAGFALVVCLFVYPKFQHDPTTYSSNTNDSIEKNILAHDSGKLAVTHIEKKNETISNEPNQESILEYLLDEEYEEI